MGHDLQSGHWPQRCPVDRKNAPDQERTNASQQTLIHAWTPERGRDSSILMPRLALGTCAYIKKAGKLSDGVRIISVATVPTVLKMRIRRQVHRCHPLT